MEITQIKLNLYSVKKQVIYCTLRAQSQRGTSYTRNSTLCKHYQVSIHTARAEDRDTIRVKWVRFSLSIRELTFVTQRAVCSNFAVVAMGSVENKQQCTMAL